MILARHQTLPYVFQRVADSAERALEPLPEAGEVYGADQVRLILYQRWRPIERAALCPHISFVESMEGRSVYEEKDAGFNQWLHVADERQVVREALAAKITRG